MVKQFGKKIIGEVINSIFGIVTKYFGHKTDPTEMSCLPVARQRRQV